jgi:N-acetylmuramoyl-L-alanine amidase
MNTPGKRTPFFPGTKKFMHENEFNSAVAAMVKVHLERNKFRTLMVAPTDEDTPLATRTGLANKAMANFYISIHANALNGVWGTQQGLSVHYYPGDQESKAAAEIIHKYMIQGTQQKDRGVKADNFHVLRETKMPAVLIECAFMDNLREAQLLMSEAFREECAEEAAKGICEIFKVAYVPPVDKAISDMVTYINKVKPNILGEVPKWIGKAVADKDTYWLLRKLYEDLKK